MNRTGTIASASAMLVIGLVAGCATSPAAEPAPPLSPTSQTTPKPAPPSPQPTTIEVTADSAALQHIHNLSLSTDTLLIGSHQGLFSQPPGEPPRRVSEPFDVMGFTIADDRWLASGHPGPDMDAPPDLGLLQSADEGKTWKPVSLTGQVDFHRLAAAGDVVLGVNSGDGMLWRSTDGGDNWDTVGPGPFDIAINPRNARQAVGTTQDGPIASTDGGKTWTPIAGAPVIALVAWTDDQLWGVTPEGAVHSSTDSGKDWRKAGEVDGQPAALAANGTRLNVLAGDKIWESLDQGASFSPRVTGIPGH